MTPKKRQTNAFSLCVILDAGILSDRQMPACAAEAISGGADMLQLRAKDRDTLSLVRIARKLKAICRRRSVPFIVNDRAEVAVASGADGLHIGQGDIDASVAKKLLGPGKILGISASSVSQARKAKMEGASYIGAGPVFATPVKRGGPAVGVNCLKRISGLGVSLVAIGGIDETNIHKLTEAGIRSAAVIRAVCSSRDKRGAAVRLKKALTR